MLGLRVIEVVEDGLRVLSSTLPSVLGLRVIEVVEDGLGVLGIGAFDFFCFFFLFPGFVLLIPASSILENVVEFILLSEIFSFGDAAVFFFLVFFVGALVLTFLGALVFVVSPPVSESFTCSSDG